MASAFHDQGLTLAPFRRAYSAGHDITLWSDNFFAVPEPDQPSVPAADSRAKLGEVVSLPSRTRFEKAVAQWKDDISFDSFPDDMKEHDSFAEIIEQGFSVVPLIAADLRREPSFLFLALEEIFGEDPVPEDAFGNVRTVSAAWLEWLQQ